MLIVIEILYISQRYRKHKIILMHLTHTELFHNIYQNSAENHTCQTGHLQFAKFTNIYIFLSSPLSVHFSV